jgi:hypothetical protein
MIPTKWCVKITKDNRKILENYRLSLPGNKSDNTCLDREALGKWLISDNQYSDNMFWGKLSKNKDYTLITFEQFQEHILGIKPVSNTSEDLSYLIDFLKQKNIN